MGFGRGVSPEYTSSLRKVPFIRKRVLVFCSPTEHGFYFLFYSHFYSFFSLELSFANEKKKGFRVVNGDE